MGKVLMRRRYREVVMRYVVGFVLALALAASPLPVSAEEGAQNSVESAEPWRHPHDRRTHSQSAAEEPALQLELDSTGVDIAPGDEVQILPLR